MTDDFSRHALMFTGQGWLIDQKYLMGKKKAELVTLYTALRAQYLSSFGGAQTRLRKAIKPYIVKRPDGGCQVLFPLNKLDAIVEAAYAAGGSHAT